MVFNVDRQSLSSKLTRGALAYYCFAMENSGANLAAVNQSHSIFNSSVVFDGNPVTDFVGDYIPSYMSGTPKTLLLQGLESAQLTQMENLTVLIPSDVSYKVVAENINQRWQKELGLFFTLEFIPNSEIEKRVEKGDFDIAFLNSKPSSSNPVTLLQSYRNLNGDLANYIAILDGGHLSSDETVKTIRLAHNDIIENAYIVPMCTDSSRYIHKDYFANIDINPFGNIINLKYAYVK